MTTLFPQFKFTKEYDKAVTLQYLHMFFCFFALFMRYIQGFDSFGFLDIFVVLSLAFIYRFMFQSLKELYYTFWTLLLIMLMYFSLHAYQFSNISEAYFLVYTIAAGVVLIQAYIMSSPLFYPRLQWWVYDFRIRDDIKIYVTTQTTEVPARLTDLRREAGCVVIFDEYPIGDIFHIKTRFLDEMIEFKTEIFSKREPCPGLGISYGVKFLFDSDEEKRLYHRFRRYWKVKSRGRIRRKFQNEDKE